MGPMAFLAGYAGTGATYSKTLSYTTDLMWSSRKRDETCDLRLFRSEKIEVSVQFLDVRD